MGLKDKLQNMTPGQGVESQPGDQYYATVNKGSLNMSSFTRTLNEQWQRGWKLAHIYSHDGNTVIVYERR